MKLLFGPFLSLITLLAANGCSTFNTPSLAFTPTVPASRNGLVLIVQADSLEVWATESDRQTAQNILAAIREHSKQICATLETECQFPIVVEVYPDQAGFD